MNFHSVVCSSGVVVVLILDIRYIIKIIYTYTMCIHAPRLWAASQGLECKESGVGCRVHGVGLKGTSAWV